MSTERLLPELVEELRQSRPSPSAKGEVDVTLGRDNANAAVFKDMLS